MDFAEYCQMGCGHELPEWQKKFLNRFYLLINSGEKLYIVPTCSRTIYDDMLLKLYVMYKNFEKTQKKGADRQCLTGNFLTD